MRVGPLKHWLPHLERGDKKELRLYQIKGTLTDPEQHWIAESQTHDRVRYGVNYFRDDDGEEFVSCTCPGYYYRQSYCKHQAGVLAEIHAQRFRRLLRDRGYVAPRRRHPRRFRSEPLVQQADQLVAKSR